MGGRGGKSGMSNKPFDRFSDSDIDMRVYNKLPKYAQDSVIAVDVYNPREYGYNEPNRYNMYYVDKSGEISWINEEGSDFLAQVRFQRSDFGKVDDFDFPSGYQYNLGDIIPRKKGR